MERQLNTQKVAKTLERLYGKYDRYQVLKDWFSLMASSYWSASLVFEGKDNTEPELTFKAIESRYTEHEMSVFMEAHAQLVCVIDGDVNNGIFKDWLGEIYMQSCTASKEKAQHFTPYSVGKLMAELNLGDKESIKKIIDEKGYITINDPCVGGGCLPIAMLATLKEYGINYQQRVIVICGDNDQRCCDMCYVQLSLIGAIATVENRNALTQELTQSRDTVFMVRWNNEWSKAIKQKEALECLIKFTGGDTKAKSQRQ